MTLNILDRPAISAEEKRQILYSALLRHFPETKTLRSRALERLVLGALYGSSQTKPLTVGDIQKVLALDSKGSSLRVETIQVVLAELVESGAVVPTERRKKNAYFLSESEAASLKRRVDDTAALINAALERVVQGCHDLIVYDTAVDVVRGFICECFTRFGRQIAKTIIGDLRNEELLNQVDVNGAFAAAIKGRSLTVAAREMLHARCLGFLRSTHPDDERVKFYLTQGYYFAHLLGIEEHGGTASQNCSRMGVFSTLTPTS